MKNELLKISIRQGAIYTATKTTVSDGQGLTETTSMLVANAVKLGFVFSEGLLKQLNKVTPMEQLTVLETLKEVKGVNKNWTPLVKGWDVPTGETRMDHVVTFFTNLFGGYKGTQLPCGHTIPARTFPLERYNGCPFCGTPFEAGKLENYGRGSKYTVLEAWDDKDLQSFFNDLLASKTALDATQVESLKVLLRHLPVPDASEIAMRETLMLVVDALVADDRAQAAKDLFANPNDVLRYLWYKHTGFLQVVSPKTIVERAGKNSLHIYSPSSKSGLAQLQSKAQLKLKYSRSECLRVAKWLNGLEMEAEKACEIMHPKRDMWVRFIRALRLAEYSKRKGFERLATLMDVFYNEQYTVWQGQLDQHKLRFDAEGTFALLKQRPGLFARSLFSSMLWFGSKTTLGHFKEVIDKVPARLVFTLSMYAPIYFDPQARRSVKPLGGTNKSIPANRLLQLYSDSQLKGMIQSVEDLCLDVAWNRFASLENSNETIFIDDRLFNIPVSIGDRSETVQDLPSALMGTRFSMEGRVVRLFMQWGTGLPAQHLDMDLSCQVAYDHKTDFCSYSQLVINGCKHSGDIQSIPHQVGTAEYIDLDVDRLAKLGARYVTFTCNAYTNGVIAPNLVVGWMDSKFPMRVSRKSGVAYDPSCVQHQVRVQKGATKGLVFGVLDVRQREIVWLEMPFSGQLVQGLDFQSVEALLAKLNNKLNIGALLTIKAEAQGLTTVATKEAADEVYDFQWAMNSAAVTQLLVD